MRRATQEWMFQILRKMVAEGYFWKKAEPLIRAAMDKYIEQVVDELAQKELKNMAREAIRAQLKKGY